MNNKGDVKLADFGLARKMGDKARMTPKVITLWYRPPELLLGHDGQSKNLGAVYSEAVDMWSAGCILAELLLEAPLLPGKEEGDQIYKIFDMFGKPTNREWPGVESFALWDRIVKKGGQKAQAAKKEGETAQAAKRKREQDAEEEAATKRKRSKWFSLRPKMTQTLFLQAR